MSFQSAYISELTDRSANIFRKTNSHKGREVFITPANSTMKHLGYARIILDQAVPQVCFENGARETALICLDGELQGTVGSQRFALGELDSVYIPSGSSIQLETSTDANVAEFSADVDGTYPLQVVCYADIKDVASLHFATGSTASSRDVSILIGKNVNAGRLLAGLTISEPGNWTSWPPHEHSAMLEEMYVFTHMPPPAFGIQFVYNDSSEPELVTVVRDGDAVLIPRGYHPNVAVPGHRIGFLWAMAAHREGEDRQFGVVNVQPEFSQSGSGLEASTK